MKKRWKRIGTEHINEPLYYKHLEKSILNDKEKKEVDYEINQLYTKLLEREHILITKINECKSFKDFNDDIIPVLEEQESEKKPILLMKGKVYHKSVFWYLRLLLLAQEQFSFKKEVDNKNKIDKYLNSKIKDIQKERHIDEKELNDIRSGKSYSLYAIEMNHLVRIIRRHYSLRLDDDKNRKKYINSLEEYLNKNPDIDNFVNSTMLAIERENEEKNEKEIEDLKTERIFLYDKLIEEIQKSNRSESEKEIEINELKTLWEH